jgi:hypothetical protein
MATCPRCLGALTENHKCPRRSIVSAVIDALSTVGIGGLLGGVVALLINEQAPTALPRRRGVGRRSASADGRPSAPPVNTFTTEIAEYAEQLFL